MAARHWTIEQRQQQAQAIQRWKPWELSTGPKSAQGKAKVSGNAYAGGEWMKLQEVIKNLNHLIGEQKDTLKYLNNVQDKHN